MRLFGNRFGNLDVEGDAAAVSGTVDKQPVIKAATTPKARPATVESYARHQNQVQLLPRNHRSSRLRLPHTEPRGPQITAPILDRNRLIAGSRFIKTRQGYLTTGGDRFREHFVEDRFIRDCGKGENRPGLPPNI